MHSATLRPALALVFLLVLGHTLANCTAVNVCTPGSTQLCVCPDGSQGKRNCSQDGVYEPCQCTETVPTETTPDTTQPTDQSTSDAAPEPVVDSGPSDTVEPAPEPVAETTPDTTPPQDETTREVPT